MRTLFVLLLVVAVAVGASRAEAMPRWGIAVKAPLSLTVQLAVPAGSPAIEVGFPHSGSALVAGKLYLAPPLSPLPLPARLMCAGLLEAVKKELSKGLWVANRCFLVHNVGT